MTDNKIDWFNEFLGSMKRRDKWVDLTKRIKEDPRDEISEKAEEEVHKEIYKYAVENNPAIDTSRQKKYEDLTQEQIEAASEGVQHIAMRDGPNKFYKNVEQLVQNIPSSTLEKLVNTQVISDNVSKSDKKVYDAFVKIQSYVDLQDRNEKKDLDEEEKKVISSMALEGAAKEAERIEKAAQKKIGYTSKKLIQIRQSIVTATVASGRANEEAIKKYVKEGFKKTIDESRKKYEELVGKGNSDEIYRIVREAIVKGSKGSVDGEKFMNLYETIYAVHTGKKLERKKN